MIHKTKYTHLAAASIAIILALSSCTEFLFFNIDQEEKRKELVIHKIPRTTADLYEAPIVEEDIPDVDPDGAFHDWATCLIMIKEGHPHAGNTMHGNYVYENSPWKQEQFAVVHNTSEGIKVEIDRKSTVTYIEDKMGREGPDYFRIIGGYTKLWGLCLYFFDKQGKLINDQILDESDKYQIFFTVSDVDDHGQPYKVLDTRYRGEKIKTPCPAAYFEDKHSFEERAQASPDIFKYTYRDTWTHESMGDGVRDLFNIRLIPPLDSKDIPYATAPYDQDCVGLKGHLLFDFDAFGKGPIDPLYDWPLVLTNGLRYTRMSTLQPQFYLAIRVLKCEGASKKYAFTNDSSSGALSKKGCAEFYNPLPTSLWQEIIRMNIHIKVYASTFDSNPTNPDPNEPYYFQIGREIGLSPEDAFEAANNVIIHGRGGGLGFGAWFL